MSVGVRTGVTIVSNGSKWAGEEPDSIEALVAVLALEPLDPRFEDFGGFFSVDDDGWMRAHGNFYGLSHVFTISGPAVELADLRAAIEANLESPAYKRARRALRRYRKSKKEVRS